MRCLPLMTLKFTKMDIVKTLHKLSHLKWVFLVVEIFLIIYAFNVSAQSEKLVSTIGILILVTGIQLGLDSLSDVTKMSEKEIKRYQERKSITIQFKSILIAILFFSTISLLFFSLKFIGSTRNESIFNAFFDLGLNLWALILGLLCLSKHIHDKNEFAKSQI